MRKFYKSITKKGRRAHKKTKEDALMRRLALINYEVEFRSKITASSHEKLGNNENDRIIVSLTSYGQRVETLWITIESLFQQTLRPDKIVLNLFKDEFNTDTIPASLKKLEALGLEIFYCDEDLGPYTKFYYTMQRYPQDIVITVDDDILYPPETIDQLYRNYRANPKSIHCTRGHKVTFDEKNQLMPYKQWLWDHSDTKASMLIFPTGVGGVLYFPGSLSDQVFEKDSFLELAPHADDLWLKAMSLAQGTSCQQTGDTRPWSNRFLQINGTQATSLKRKNKSAKQGNDYNFSRLLDHYSLWDQFKG